MTTVNVYLTFNGNCEEAFNFYRAAFDGEFSYIGKFKDIPSMEGMPPITEDEANRIMHIALPISKETVLMGSDTSSYSGDVTFGNNFSIAVSTDSKEKADQIFNALSEGGKVIMPMNNQFWGDYFGMLTDKFGINWMVSYELPKSN